MSIKSFILSLVLCAVSTGGINASGCAYSIGNFTYYNDDNGDTYTSYSIGDFDYITGSNGYSGCGYSIGSFYYYND